MTENSTFARRFEYTRARQHGLGTWQEDAVLAEAMGVAASQISGYKGRDEAPPAKRTLALAKACGVDPGWLAFGAESQAPAPEGFAEWLDRRYPPKPQASSGGKLAHDPHLRDREAITHPKRRPA